jgi:hypothetical protein
MRRFHIPSDLVVERGASSVRDNVILDFPCILYSRHTACQKIILSISIDYKFTIESGRIWSFRLSPYVFSLSGTAATPDPLLTAPCGEGHPSDPVVGI